MLLSKYTFRGRQNSFPMPFLRQIQKLAKSDNFLFNKIFAQKLSVLSLFICLILYVLCSFYLNVFFQNFGHPWLRQYTYVLSFMSRQITPVASWIITIFASIWLNSFMNCFDMIWHNILCFEYSLTNVTLVFFCFKVLLRFSFLFMKSRQMIIAMSLLFKSWKIIWFMFYTSLDILILV